MVQETLLLFRNNEKPIFQVLLILTARQAYMTRYEKSIPLYNIQLAYFKNSFFFSNIDEWNNLDPNIRNSESGAFPETHIRFHKTFHK